MQNFFFSSIKISSHDGESGEGKSVKWKSYFRYTSWCAFDMKWNWKFFNVKNFQEILKVLWGKHLCVNCRTSMSRHFPIFIHYCKSFFLPHLIMKDRSPDKHKNYFSFFFWVERTSHSSVTVTASYPTMLIEHSPFFRELLCRNPSFRLHATPQWMLSQCNEYFVM